MSADDREAVQGALREVRVRAEACAQAPDLDAAKVALDAVWAATTRARIALNTAEANAKNAAQAKNTAALFARLERISA